jgi:hypothetical protein
VHTVPFLTLHLTFNGCPTPTKQFEYGHRGEISTAQKEPVEELLVFIRATPHCLIPMIG